MAGMNSIWQSRQTSFLLLRLLAIVSLLVMSGANADEFQVSSNIDSVTVYEQGAEVTRVGQISIPAGEHRLIIENLPQRIQAERLRISIDSPAVRLGNLQLEDVHRGELVNEEERRLQEELDQLLYEKQEISDLMEAANTQLRLLSSLADGSVGGQQTSLSVDDVAALLETLSSSSIQARTVIRDASRDILMKDRDIERKRFELSQVATRNNREQLLSVAVDSDQAINSSVRITYAVDQARWSWLYEARLDTQQNTLNLQRNVSVLQSSGEDWSDVVLKITTARPTEQTAAPDIESVYVDFYKERPVALNTLSRSSANASLEEVVVTGSNIRSYSNVVASQYLVEYEIPGRVSVTADSQQQILPIDERGIDIDLVHLNNS